MTARLTGLCRMILLLTVGAGALACPGHGSTLSSTPKAPTAKALAERVDHHYNSLHSLKAQFTETYQGLGMNRTESGTLLLLKPGRMRWDYSSPAGKVFLLDGKYAWSYTRGDAQASRIPAKQLSDLRSPLRYLLGHADLSRELRNLTLSPAQDGLFTLAGVPKGMEDRVSRLELTVTGAGVIEGIAIDERDGAVTRFTFADQQPDAPISASAFHFTPPAGVQVVDSLPPI